MSKIFPILGFIGGILIGGVCLALALKPVQIKSRQDNIIQVEPLIIQSSLPVVQNSTIPEVKIVAKQHHKHRTTLPKVARIQCVYRPLESGGTPTSEFVKSCGAMP